MVAALGLALLVWMTKAPRAGLVERRMLTVPRRRVLVVLQFAVHQWGLLKESLQSWTHPLVFPCEAGDGTPWVDLVLYVSRDDEGTFARTCIPFVEQLSWRRCFGRILFRSCALSVKEDVYGVGTVTMFYRMFRDDFVPGFGRYDYAFLMEPDTRPVRRGWLDALEATAAGNRFWQKGSVPRYATLADDLHINGNAFYRLGDEASTAFFLASKGAYQEAISFDQSIHVYRFQTRVAQETAHLFVATEFIVNNWRDYTYWTVPDVLEQLPDTYLVHGKHAVKAQCSYLNCSHSAYGKMSKIGG